MHGIWKHKEIRKELNISDEQYISQEEGSTEASKLEANLILKREDKNPSGSWKDRGTAYKLTKLISEDKKEFVMPSSGNAAISFMHYARNFPDIKINVVISPNTPIKKKDLLYKLAGDRHEIIENKFAKRTSIKISQEKNIPVIRAALDEDLVKGYWSLGFEIYKLIRESSYTSHALVVPVSSGTALLGIIEGLFIKSGDEYQLPKIIACQTQSCHPLVKSDIQTEEKSLASSISDKSMLRKPQIEQLLDKTNGFATAISNDEILEAQKYLMKNYRVRVGYTSALTVAAYLKHNKRFKDFQFICITSGL